LLPLALLSSRRGAVVGLLPLLILVQPEPASAQVWDQLWLTADQQGQRALAAGDTQRAQRLFQNEDWAGTAAYAGEDYEAAAEYFSEPQSADTWYNRANALAKGGDLDGAIEAYKESLALQPEETDAQENLALLEQMKQQQEQEQQQQDEESDQDQQQDSDNEQQNSDTQDSEQQQDQQSDPSEDSQDDSSQDEQQNQDQKEDEGDEEPSPTEPEPTEQEQQQEQEQQAAESTEDSELDQAMEQWLRRVPDDPSGLLREKFRYESRQRQQENGREKNETLW